jgi:hypothetical protein
MRITIADRNVKGNTNNYIAERLRRIVDRANIA